MTKCFLLVILNILFFGLASIMEDAMTLALVATFAAILGLLFISGAVTTLGGGIAFAGVAIAMAIVAYRKGE